MPGMPEVPAMPAMPAMPQTQPTQPAQPAQPQLETMYPNTYNIISPVVENVCDNMISNNGNMNTITNKQMEAMINDVCKKVEPNVEAEIKKNLPKEERQLYGGSRSLLRDFVGALIIGSLIRRRHPYYGYQDYGYPGYYGGGYGGGFPY
jgi:hypothetical protein